MGELTELAWAAGFFEGEGHVSISKRAIQDRAGRRYASEAGRTMIALIVNNCELPLLERFQAAVGVGTIISSPYDSRRKPGYKKAWRWHATSAAAVKQVIGAIYPFMSGEKRARMDAMREVLAAKRSLHATRDSARERE